MIKILSLLIGLALAGTAQAQIKCWTEANGKRACGDMPPPGARLETPRGAPAPAAAPEAKKGTPASAPQAEPLRATVKPPQERVPDLASAMECERAQRLLREMGGGGRSRRTDAVKARALADRNC